MLVKPERHVHVSLSLGLSPGSPREPWFSRGTSSSVHMHLIMEGELMKLVGTYLSPFSRRVAASLISRGVSYTHEDVNGYLSPEKAQALNPVGKVPVLILDDGEALIDSMAILDHLN